MCGFHGRVPGGQCCKSILLDRCELASILGSMLILLRPLRACLAGESVLWLASLSLTLSDLPTPIAATAAIGVGRPDRHDHAGPFLRSKLWLVPGKLAGGLLLKPYPAII